MSTEAAHLTTNRKRALYLLGAATLALTAALYLLDPHTRGSGGPEIVAFEFAGSRSRAMQIMAEWGAEGRRLARLGLWLDYAYMLSYGLFFALAGFAVHDAADGRGWRRTARLGAVVPYFALAAASFDACENAALLLTLGGHGGNLAPPFATACSSLKWLLIGSAILYAAWGAMLLLLERLGILAMRASPQSADAGAAPSGQPSPGEERADRGGLDPSQPGQEPAGRRGDV